METDPLPLLADLIRCPSVTPNEAGVLDHEVRPEATATGRGARLHPILRSSDHTPLLVERLGAEQNG